MAAEQDRLTAALADRYHILNELGRGGMATVFLAEGTMRESASKPAARYTVQPELGSGGMATVHLAGVIAAEAAARRTSLKRRGGSARHFSDISRAAALAADSRARRARA